MGDLELHFDSDLYAGTAEFYDQYRSPYPAEVIDELRSRVPLVAGTRGIDLACGTGQIAFGLAKVVGEVWAIDQEREFVEFGRHKAARSGIENIRWITSAAEEVELDGAFSVVTVGNAFHRLDRRAVIERLVPHLADDGCIALLWSWSPWQGERSWQRTLKDVMERWVDDLGARERVPTGWERAMQQVPHRDVLDEAGLEYEGRVEIPVVERWTTASLIGNVYSSSHLNRRVLGLRALEFEDDLRAELLALDPSDAFTQDQIYAIDLARHST